MAPPIASANSSAARDLPLAVGPAIRMASMAKAETSMSDASEIVRFTMLAEEAMSAIYDARGVNVRAALEDAAYNIEQALAIARMRSYTEQIETLTKKRARIQAMFDARFKKKRPQE